MRRGFREVERRFSGDRINEKSEPKKHLPYMDIEPEEGHMSVEECNEFWNKIFQERITKLDNEEE